jgi:NAD(P)-dependent dehydrogenase (short-subunit alcohol dehydrogenase family)
MKMDKMFRLDGKVALVTGASAGLGKRFAAVLAGAGAKVALCARRTDKLASLAQEIAATGGTAFPIALDVTNVAAIRACIESVEAELGPLDILVNNSGTEVQKRVADYEEADYDLVMDTNAKGAFFVAQAAGRRMIAAKRPGRIINIASAIGLRVISQLAVYGMSKASMIQMTKAMAHEWTRHRICVNAICPGYIETEMNSHYWNSEGGRKLLGLLPGRRVGRPEDLDGLLLLLASDNSHFINGAVIAADDGFAVG